MPASVASYRSDKTVTTEARIIEPLIKIAGLSDVKEFTFTDEKIDPRNIISVNRETTESPITVLVELSVSFVLILRVILYCMAGFIAFWDYRLNEAETVTK